MKRFLNRSLIVLLAYMAASFAAGITLGFASLIGGTLLPAVENVGKVLVVGGILFGATIAMLAGVPSLICIILAERFGWRGLPLHLILAAAIATAIYVLTNNEMISSAATTVAFTAAGTLAGLVYWAIAGRHAGMWSAPT